MKTLDLSQSVYTLCSQNKGLADILKQMGFTDITKPGMLATAGRFMTISKGAAQTVKKVFKYNSWARRAVPAQPTLCGFAQFRV